MILTGKVTYMLDEEKERIKDFKKSLDQLIFSGPNETSGEEISEIINYLLHSSIQLMKAVIFCVSEVDLYKANKAWIEFSQYVNMKLNECHLEITKHYGETKNVQ